MCVTLCDVVEWSYGVVLVSHIRKVRGDDVTGAWLCVYLSGPIGK